MKNKLFLSAGLALSLFGLVACASEGTEPKPNPEQSQQEQVDIQVDFTYNEQDLTITKQDSLTNKVVGDFFSFTIKLNDGVKISKILGNGEPLKSSGLNSYRIKLKNGKNVVVIETLSTSVPYTATKLDINPKATQETLWKNWGFPHYPTTGNQKLLVIPVQFKDADGSEFANDKVLGQIEKAFFGDSTNTYFESVSSFYKKSSYGKLNITGQVTPWFNCNLTEDEVFANATKEYRDSGIFALSNSAINWVKSTLASTINLADYDNNKDGYIDGIYFIYNKLDAMSDPYVNPDHLDLRWNHTFYNILNANPEIKKDPKNPIAMTYSWSSFNMMNRAYQDAIDAHTFIHEFGHQLGLDDYYDTGISQGNQYTSPMGGLDMMDYNIGDHSMYSKYALGWTAPTLVSGNSGEVKVTLKPSYIDGDFAIIRGDGFNGLPFDEYIAIEYLSNDSNENNLNYFDSVNAYPVTSKVDGSKVTTYKESGIRVTHIDARAIDIDTNYTDSLDTMIKTKFSNTGNISNGFRDPQTNNSYVLTTLISANINRNVQGVNFTANSSDLFKQGDAFTFRKGVEHSYADHLPSLTNKLNDGSKLTYLVSIDSMTKDSVSLTIKAN